MLNWATALPVSVFIVGVFALVISLIRMNRDKGNPGNSYAFKRKIEGLVKEATCRDRQKSIVKEITLTRDFLKDRIDDLANRMDRRNNITKLGGG